MVAVQQEAGLKISDCAWVVAAAAQYRQALARYWQTACKLVVQLRAVRAGREETGEDRQQAGLARSRGAGLTRSLHRAPADDDGSDAAEHTQHWPAGSRVGRIHPAAGQVERQRERERQMKNARHRTGKVLVYYARHRTGMVLLTPSITPEFQNTTNKHRVAPFLLCMKCLRLQKARTCIFGCAIWCDIW